MNPVINFMLNFELFFTILFNFYINYIDEEPPSQHESQSGNIFVIPVRNRGFDLI
jgi:hypothetical protein